MSEHEQAVEPVTFKDRTVGLIVYGSVEILIGGFCALAVPLMVFVAFVPQPDGQPAGLRMMMPAVGL